MSGCSLDNAVASFLQALRNISTSTSVVAQPRLTRTAPRRREGETLIAARTWEGCTLPDEQAAPEETATPSRSKAITVVSAFMPGAANSVVLGNRAAVAPKITVCGELDFRPDSSASRDASMCAASVSRCRSAATAAAPMHRGNFLRTLATPEPIKEWSLTNLREKLIKIGAKVVSHGRYVTFQMAEVAMPRQMFEEILRLIGSYGRTHHQCQYEEIDGQAFVSNRWEACAKMLKENGQIRPHECPPGAWNGGSSRHRPPVLREGQKSANIHATMGSIWGILVSASLRAKTRK
jgi:DDE family transposase